MHLCQLSKKLVEQEQVFTSQEVYDFCKEAKRDFLKKVCREKMLQKGTASLNRSKTGKNSVSDKDFSVNTCDNWSETQWKMIDSDK